SAGLDEAKRAHLEEMRRTQFFDLPRFLNPNAKDVRSYTKDALALLAGDRTEDHEQGAHALQRLGGAALPYVVPLLDSLGPDARGRAAVALGPVADRMGLPDRDRLAEPESAALFWARFWDDRALDFAPAAVDRAVARLVEHGSEQRETDLVALDTFALP